MVKQRTIIEMITEIRDISFMAISNDKPKTTLEKDQQKDLKAINKLMNKIENMIN